MYNQVSDTYSEEKDKEIEKDGGECCSKVLIGGLSEQMNLMLGEIKKQGQCVSYKQERVVENDSWEPT